MNAPTLIIGSAEPRKIVESDQNGDRSQRKIFLLCSIRT